MKILVVEDSRSNLAILCAYIERFGSSVVTADCGDQAIERFNQSRPDLILLDVVLPDIDGYTVAQRIRAIEKPGDWTPIIFLSSLGEDSHIERGIAAGGDDYLLKPVSEMVLGAKVRAMQRIVQMRASLVALTRKLDAANQELMRLSSSDGLTGVANRRFFDEAISVEWRRARRNGTQVALLMCDVDAFKGFNDAYGHLAGDDCLRQVASAIRRNTLRPSDIVARYGGEEFSVILPETTLGGALMVAEKIRYAVRELNITHGGSPHGRVTISIGIAAAMPIGENQPETLIHAADQALYRAKHEGRDRVCRAEAE